MFRHKRTIFREHNMSGFKPIASDSHYLHGSRVCSRFRCRYRVCINGKACTIFFNLWLKYDLKYFLHNKYDLYRLKLLLQLVVETCSL
jgi:hypothetical protein